jgi:hypothetical protein
MQRIWLFWLTLLSLSFDAAAEECSVRVDVEAKRCSIEADVAQSTCAAHVYLVRSDRPVRLLDGERDTLCAQPGCTIADADADATSVRLLESDGRAIQCGTRTVPGTDSSRAAATLSLERALLSAGIPNPQASAAPDAGRSSQAEPKFDRIELSVLDTTGEATGAAQVMDDLFRTVAAVAMDRAQTRVAQRAIDAAKEALCDEKTRLNESWPNTCGVLAALTPATLGTVADALRSAIARDVAAWVAKQLAGAPDQEYLTKVLEGALLPLITDPGDIGRDDLLRLLNALLTREWKGGRRADVVNLVFYVVRVCGREANAEACSVDVIVDKAIDMFCAGATPTSLCEVLKQDDLEIRATAGRLAVLTRTRKLSSGELRRALKELVDVTLLVAEAVAEPSPGLAPAPAEPAGGAAGSAAPTPGATAGAAVADVGAGPAASEVAAGGAAARVEEGRGTPLLGARLLFAAMLEDDAFSFALQIGEVVEITARGQKVSPKVKALLTAILAYAQTYRKDPPEGEDPAEKRKEVIEALVTAATDRSQRAGDWIASLGVNAGFIALGIESVDGDARVLVPQLALPFGVFLQRKSEDYPGFHTGAFFADVAQYAAFDKDGETTDVRWDTAVALGVQLGIILGSIADPLVIGVDGRYAPTLFSEAASSDPASGGAFRLGLFASYYVPFFDFN